MSSFNKYNEHTESVEKIFKKHGFAPDIIQNGLSYRGSETPHLELMFINEDTGVSLVYRVHRTGEVFIESELSGNEKHVFMGKFSEKLESCRSIFLEIETALSQFLFDRSIARRVP